MVNFVANAWHRFWHDKWNWFDVIIIVASTAVIFSNTTNNVLIKQTRILRSLRVARVFDRFGNIREIAMAISASIMPAANALVSTGTPPPPPPTRPTDRLTRADSDRLGSGLRTGGWWG